MSRARAGKSRRSEGMSTIRFIIVVAFLAWAFRSFVFGAFSIPSGSMLPTLRIGDYLFVAKWPYGYSRFSFPLQFPPFRGRVLAHFPERGDIVVFVPPGDDQVDFVKRVIGVPGDVVEVRGGRVILNGKPLRLQRLEPVRIPISPNSPCRTTQGAQPRIAGRGGNRACLYTSYRETLPNGASYRILDQVTDSIADDWPATTVPAGRLFLMGDNRDDSLDSRFSPAEGGIGFVPLDRVVGRAELVFWSTDGSANYAKPWTWFTALRGNRLGHNLEPTTR